MQTAHDDNTAVVAFVPLNTQPLSLVKAVLQTETFASTVRFDAYSCALFYRWRRKIAREIKLTRVVRGFLIFKVRKQTPQ